MKCKFFLFLSCLFVLMSLGVPSYAIDWVNSFDEALAQAKEGDKPVMVDFYTDWCGWCRKLDNETYKDPAVVELARGFICLKIGADKEPALARKYNVRVYPTILFVDSEGNILGGGAGFRDAGRLSAEMKAVINSRGGAR